MRNPHITLNKILLNSGIQPSSFAFFLSAYIKRKPNRNMSVLSILLTRQLQEQAKIIEHHLNR